MGQSRPCSAAFVATPLIVEKVSTSPIYEEDDPALQPMLDLRASERQSEQGLLYNCLDSQDASALEWLVRAPAGFWQAVAMTKTELSADYLVIGAGAMGMAFVDTLLTETDATVVMVDRRAKPGGHWNTAYPFVRLHQPSSFYGVNSVPLGSDRIDEAGWNAGLYELASGDEVVSYFDQIMNQRFLPSGRVHFFPMCNYGGNSTFHSTVSGDEFTVTGEHGNHKTVDATYMNVTVPSMRPPAYDVADGVTCVPLNDLPSVAGPDRDYAVVGAGKTAMDAVLWLLANRADPAQIRWVMPRDSWLLDRQSIQPGDEFAEGGLRFVLDPMEAAVAATDVDDMFARIEATGQMMRIDETVQPTMYRCATVTRSELEQLRRVNQVIRLGRVVSIEPNQIVMTEGTSPCTADTVIVDCTADGLANRPPVPVFAGDTITLQSVRTCQQVFSAAFLAHLEATRDTDDEKNQFATPVPHPNTHLDYLRAQMTSGLNSFGWRMDPGLSDWLEQSRLDAFSTLRSGVGQSPAEEQMMARIAEIGPAALGALQELLAAAEAD